MERLSSGDDALADGEADEIGLRTQAQLPHQIRPVRLRGARADEEGLADLDAGLAFRGELEDFPLAIGERFVDVEVGVDGVRDVAADGALGEDGAEATVRTAWARSVAVASLST